MLRFFCSFYCWCVAFGVSFSWSDFHCLPHCWLVLIFVIAFGVASTCTRLYITFRRSRANFIFLFTFLANDFIDSMRTASATPRRIVYASCMARHILFCCQSKISFYVLVVERFAGWYNHIKSLRDRKTF